MKKVGCYYCEEVFSENEVRDYTIDNHAICPYCCVDSICDVTNPAKLRELHKYWFDRECPEDQYEQQR